jgi:hypothetical protein
MSDDAKTWRSIIVKVAQEQTFEVVGADNKTVCEIYIDKWHAVAFQLRVNRVGYINAFQWECDDKGKNPKYGRSVYSIRSYTDCIHFCSILMASSSIRSKRKT